MAWPPRKAFQPHEWQVAACDAWEQARRRGILEAVTGTGKTYVALEAIARLAPLDPSLDILIVVPTIPLLDQWRDRLTAAFPDQRIGLIGGGHSDDYSKIVLACVAVIHSAVPRLPDLFAHVRRGQGRTLLIADECHHYAEAPVWSNLTREWDFDYVLGLSATMERYEVNGLGRIIYEYRFQDALRDDLIPEFDLVNIGVHLRPAEQAAYLRLSDQLRDQWVKVWDLYDAELRYVASERLFRKLHQLMTRGSRDESKWDPIIKRLFSLIYQRAVIAYTAANKIGLVDRLLRLLVGQHMKKAIAFFERIESADFVGEAIERRIAMEMQVSLRSDGGIWCRTYHSGLDRKERDRTLAAFAATGASVLLACRALDEGLDIPAIDAAVLVASTQSPRQRIQRIGRTLRRGEQGKRPIVVTLFALGTNDENVSADDRRMFKDVATIYEERGEAGYERVQALLGAAGPARTS